VDLRTMAAQLVQVGAVGPDRVTRLVATIIAGAAVQLCSRRPARHAPVIFVEPDWEMKIPIAG
jgi:hypothetical protein